MRFQYFHETDMLYIKLAGGTSTESEEVAEGIVLDFDAQNKVIGIEIEDASKYTDLSSFEVLSLPIVDFIFRERESVKA